MRVRLRPGTEFRRVDNDEFAGRCSVSWIRSGAVIRDGRCYFRTSGSNPHDVYCDAAQVLDQQFETVGPSIPASRQWLFLVTEQGDSDPAGHPDDPMTIELEALMDVQGPDREEYFGYAIVRAGSLAEAKVVFEAWFDGMFGDNAFQESRVRVDYDSLDSDGPSSIVWEAGLR